MDPLQHLTDFLSAVRWRERDEAIRAVTALAEAIRARPVLPSADEIYRAIKRVRH